MRFAEIIGHEAAIGLLRRALGNGRLPHALLFQGPEGVGKGTVARALASAMLCEQAGDDSCGRCTSCLKVSHGNHPDLLVVRRVPKKITDSAPLNDARETESASEAKDLSPLIRVFQIRELSRHASHAPRESSSRAFVIDPADRMNEEAQNALLKTLEEPPGRAVLLLVASRPHLLLPTVRSRCLTVGLGATEPRELSRALERRGMPPAEAAARAGLARGRAGRALSLDVETLTRRRTEILAALEQLVESPRALGRLPGLVSITVGDNEDEFLEGLALVEELLRDAGRLAAGLGENGSPDDAITARLAGLGRRLGTKRAAELVLGVGRLRGELRLNVNRTLITESLLAAVAGGPLP